MKLKIQNIIYLIPNYFLNSVVEKIKMPLLLHKDIDYPSLIIKAGKQIIKRRLLLVR